MKTLIRPLDRLHYALAWLGWPGVAGLLLLMAAGLAQSLQVEPLRVASAELQRQAEHLTRQASSAREINMPRQAELVATLPGIERMPEAVARLFAAAKHAGLILQQGAYRTVGDKQGKEKSSDLSRYQISLPVTGDYPAVRAFVAEALEREPSLALDGMRLVRERMDLGEIEAELRFTLYLGGGR
jgi:hypothetical protein